MPTIVASGTEVITVLAGTFRAATAIPAHVPADHQIQLTPRLPLNDPDQYFFFAASSDRDPCEPNKAHIHICEIDRKKVGTAVDVEVAWTVIAP